MNGSPQKQSNGVNGRTSSPSQMEQKIQQMCQKVFTAVQKMHANDTSSEERRLIDAFLSKEFPRDDISWQVIRRFLSTPNAPHQAHFYAANIFRRKICRDLKQIPQKEHTFIHSTLLGYMNTFQPKQNYFDVNNQLCLADATLLIQRAEWSDAILELSTQLGQKAPTILLSILQLYAEELNTWRLPFPETLRKQSRHNASKHAKYVLNMLEEFFKAANGRVDLQLHVFKCFNAWIYSMEDIADQLMGTSKLTKCLFEALKEEKTFNVAAMSIRRLLRIPMPPDPEEENTEAVEEQQNLWQKSMSILVPRIIGLIPQFEAALKEEDTEQVESLTHIFVECGETYNDWAARSTDAQPLLGVILTATKQYEERQTAGYTLYFWDKYLSPCANHAHRSRPRGVKDVFDDFDRQWPPWAQFTIQTVIPQLVPALVLNCEFPTDYQDLDPDEKDLISSHRWQCSDILAKISKIVGVRKLINLLKNLLMQLSNTNLNVEQQCSRIEAILFSVRSNYKVYSDPPPKDHPLFDIIRQIPNLPKSWRVRDTALTLVQRHSNFLVLDNEVFNSIMNYVCDSLNDIKIANSGAVCIRTICENYCEETWFRRQFTDSLLRLYDYSFTLHIHDASEITIGVTEVLKQAEYYQRSFDHLQRLLAKPFEILSGLLNKKPVDQKQNVYTTMKRIATIFKHYDTSRMRDDPTKFPNMHIALFEKFWPLFKQLLSNNGEDEVAEHTTRCIKYTIRYANVEFIQTQLFLEVLDTVINLNQTAPRSCYLYVVSIYVDEYGSDPRVKPKLLDTLAKVSGVTFKTLTDEQSFIDNPETVEDYFELARSYLKCIREMYEKKDWISEIFKKSLNGVLLMHRESSDACIKFITDLLRNRRDSDVATTTVDAILQQSGADLVHRLMRGLSCEIDYSRLHGLLELLNVLYKTNKTAVSQLMKRSLDMINLPTEFPTREEFVERYCACDSERERRHCATDYWQAANRYKKKEEY